MVARVRTVAALLALLATVDGDRAGAEIRPPYGGLLIGSLLSEPVSLDPVAAQTHAEVALVSLVYDTLYRIDDDGRPQPHLAAAPPRWRADRREARISLVRGARFHDGSTVDADDVVRSLRRTAASGAGWLLASVAAIAADGDQVVLALRRPTPDLPLLLSAPATAVTPGGLPPRGDRMIGSGPFRVTSFERARRRVQLAANDVHFAGRAYADALELRWYPGAGDEARLYERGEVHMSLRGEAAFAGHRPKYATRMVVGPATLLVYVGFGRVHAQVTANRELRRALSLSLARDGFRSIGTGERVVPTVTAAAVDIGGATTSREDRDVRAPAAAAALQRALAADPGLRAAASGQVDLEVLIDETRLDDRAVAEKVVAALYRLGVRAHITAVPAARFAARVDRGECDLYIGQLAPPVPSADVATVAAFAAGGDRWLDSLLASRPVSAAQAQTWFTERLPVLPLFHRSVRVHHRADVRGVGFDPLTRLSLPGIYLHGRAGPPGSK